MKKNVSIIGAGEIGNTIRHLIRSDENNVDVWDIDSSRVPGQRPLVKIIPDSRVVFLCVPSWAIRVAVAGISGYLNPDTLIVSISKGIEEATGMTVDELLSDVLPLKQPYAIMSGPMLAEELLKDMPGSCIVASTSKTAFHELDQLFANSKLKLEYSPNIKSVALAGMVKNIYSLALGIADGLGLGGNTKGWLTSVSISEMQGILLELGGNPDTALGLAGVADLVATGFSPFSRNRQAGDDLVRKGECCIRSEGTVSLPILAKKLGRKVAKFPILDALCDIAIHGKDAKIAFDQLFNAPKK